MSDVDLNTKICDCERLSNRARDACEHAGATYLGDLTLAKLLDIVDMSNTGIAVMRELLRLMIEHNDPGIIKARREERQFFELMIAGTTSGKSACAAAINANEALNYIKKYEESLVSDHVTLRRMKGRPTARSE